jgi:cytochrome c oxidase subunit 3
VEHNYPYVKRLGLSIFLLLAFLTAAEFFVAQVFQSVFLLAVIALAKAGLVLYYYMHIHRLAQADRDADEDSYPYKLGTNRIGLWLFLVSDFFVFAGLLISRFNLLGLTRPHLNQNLGLIVTSALLLSSFFMNRAETAMEHGDKRGFVIGTLLTFLLGLAFVIGVVALEWPMAIAEGVTPNGSVAGGIFFMMTGMHAFHVLTGLVFLLVVLRNGWRNKYSAEKHWGVEAATVYWHFVDVVWIFFYPALYLIGTIL